MCDDITCEDLYVASVAGMDDITCDDLTYDDLNQRLASVDGMDDIPCEDLTYDDLSPECVRLWDGLTIQCVKI